MKRWIASLFTLALLPALTACSAAASERMPFDRGTVYNISTNEKKPEGRVKEGMELSDQQTDDGLYSGWIEVCDPVTGRLLWYMRITGSVVVYVYPDSDYWDGSEYRFNERDGWYYTGTGGEYNRRSFALKTDGNHDFLELPDGTVYYLYRIREKQPWLRQFEEMISAYESRPQSEDTGSWRRTSVKETDNDGSVVYWVETEYDAGGNKIRETFRNAEDITRGSYITSEYDESGNISLETSWVYDPEIDCFVYGYSLNYIYDPNGMLIRIEREEADLTRYVWMEFRYDRYGNEICVITYASDGSVIDEDYTDYAYDQNGNIRSACKEYYYQGTYSGTLVSEYDAEGRILVSDTLDQEGNSSCRFEYSYDPSGRLTHEYERMVNPDGYVSTTEKTYVYDDANEMIYESVVKDGVLCNDAEIILDVNGNPLYETWICYQDEYNSYINTVSHVYDENGLEIETVRYDGNWDLYSRTEYEYTSVSSPQAAADFWEWGEAYFTGSAC